MHLPALHATRAEDAMSILPRLVVAWLALAWSGSAAARDSEVLLEFGEDTVLAEMRLPLRELEAALGRRLDPAGPLRTDVARYLGTHIDPVSAASAGPQ